jgi:hypothetical protein
MIELLWTFSFSTTTNIHEILQKRLDLCQWLKANFNSSIPNVRLASQGILLISDSNNKTLSNSFDFCFQILNSNSIFRSNNIQSSFITNDKSFDMLNKC